MSKILIDEATVKLALEALDAIGSQYVCGATHHTKAQQHHGFEACPNELTHEAAITALREALAEQPAQQEPFEYWNAVEGWVKIDEVRQHFDSVGCGTIYKTPGDGRVPLTTAQRTWVGLTDKEANKLWESTDSDWELMKRTEAKLKEKNNG